MGWMGGPDGRVDEKREREKARVEKRKEEPLANMASSLFGSVSVDSALLRSIHLDLARSVSVSRP